MVETAEIRRTFGDWLKNHIKAAGFKNKALAETLGIHEVTLSRIICGKIGVRRDMVSAISEALGLDICKAMAAAGFSAGSGRELPAELIGLEFSKLSHKDLQEVRAFVEFKISMQLNTQAADASKSRTVSVSKVFVKKAAKKGQKIPALPNGR